MIPIGAPSNQIGYRQQLTNNVVRHAINYFISFILQNNTPYVYVGHGWIVAIYAYCWAFLSSFESV